MNVFETPEFVAAHQARGGSPFRSLDRSQQANLLSALHLSVSSIRHHPGFNENEARTDADVKRLNDILIGLVNTIVRPQFFFQFPSLKSALYILRSLLKSLVPCSFGVITGSSPSAVPLANIIFPVPIPVHGAYLRTP